MTDAPTPELTVVEQLEQRIERADDAEALMGHRPDSCPCPNARNLTLDRLVLAELRELAMAENILGGLMRAEDIEVRASGPGVPQEGEPFLGLDYCSVDLSRDEADYLARIADQVGAPTAWGARGA